MRCSLNATIEGNNFNASSCRENKCYRIALYRLKLPNMLHFHTAPRDATGVMNFTAGKYLQ